MMRLLADENVNGKTLRGILRRIPDADIVRVQDIEIAEAPDPVVLEWAATHRRLLLTQDVDTMPKYANQRIAAELPMPGVFVARQDLPIGLVIEQMVTIISASEPHEWNYQVSFLPL